jgi:hypothetical protein
VPYLAYITGMLTSVTPGYFFIFEYWGVESILRPLGTTATPVVPLTGECDDDDDDDGEVGGMYGFGRRNRRRKSAPTPLCPPQIPLARRPGPPRWEASD